jgi:hypothetical protein
MRRVRIRWGNIDFVSRRFHFGQFFHPARDIL